MEPLTKDKLGTGYPVEPLYKGQGYSVEPLKLGLGCLSLIQLSLSTRDKLGLGCLSLIQWRSLQGTS